MKHAKVKYTESLSAINCQNLREKFGMNPRDALWHDLGDYQLVELADGSVTASWILNGVPFSTPCNFVVS